MNRRTILLLSTLLILGVGGVVGYKIWNKPFKDPLEGNAIRVTATQLFHEFITNEGEAQKKYVSEKPGDKKVEVTGQINEVGENEDGEIYYTLKTSDEMFGVKCIMDMGKETAQAKAGDNITVRGYCDGYNMDVIINRCRLVN